MTQDRNAHDYLADMDAEADLYFKAGKLVDFLATWDARAAETVPEAMETLWIALYERTYVELADVGAVQRWLAALDAAGYRFPPFPDRQPPSHPGKHFNQNI